MFETTIENYLTDESNVFASSRMVGNAEVAPVDTVAPDVPSDTVKDKISFILSPNPLC